MKTHSSNRLVGLLTKISKAKTIKNCNSKLKLRIITDYYGLSRLITENSVVNLLKILKSLPRDTLRQLGLKYEKRLSAFMVNITIINA